MENLTKKKEKKGSTREIPGVGFVHVDIGDHMWRKAATANLALKVVENKLLVCGAESEPWRPATALSPTSHLSIALSPSLSLSLTLSIDGSMDLWSDRIERGE